jgi:hypothetical protein
MKRKLVVLLLSLASATSAPLGAFCCSESLGNGCLDYQFCYGFGAGVTWTHFNDKGTINFNEDANTINTTRCNLKLDQLDFVLSYQTTLCCGLNLKPILGLRWAKINEGVNASLVTDILQAGIPSTETRLLNDVQNYSGVGPILGLWGDFDLGCGFGLYGSATVGLLYGDHKLTFNDTSIGTIATTSSFQRKHLHTCNWNADLAIGIVWRTDICDGYTVAFNLGFEHHQYFNQSHLGVSRGDLMLDGVVFGANLSF